ASREVDAPRARAIEVSMAIRAVLEPYIAGHIAKWDDTFNPRAFGDLTAASGVSTVLIESGGIEGDLQKQQLRKLNFLALIGALDAIATGAHAGLPRERYDELPGNGRVWPDLLVTGGTLALPGQPQARMDLLVDFQQPLLERGGTISDIGDLGEVQARRTIDASGLYIVPFNPRRARSGARRTVSWPRPCRHTSSSAATRRAATSCGRWRAMWMRQDPEPSAALFAEQRDQALARERDEHVAALAKAQRHVIAVRLLLPGVVDGGPGAGIAVG